MVFESTVLLRRRPLLLFAAAQAQMLAQADLLGYLRHVLPAHQPGTNARQLALAPLRMHGEERFGHHETQHGVAEKFQALVVGRSRRFLPASVLRELVGQRTMRERAHQQLRAREIVPECCFKLVQVCFQRCLAVNRCSQI